MLAFFTLSVCIAPAGSEQSLALLFSTIAVAVKQIAGKVSRAGLEGLFGVAEQQGGGSGDTQKKLDVVAVRPGTAAFNVAQLPPFSWFIISLNKSGMRLTLTGCTA